KVAAGTFGRDGVLRGRSGSYCRNGAIRAARVQALGHYSGHCPGDRAVRTLARESNQSAPLRPAATIADARRPTRERGGAARPRWLFGLAKLLESMGCACLQSFAWREA